MCACGKTKQTTSPQETAYPYNTMSGIPGSYNSEFYGVTANLVGQTKVNGDNYLTDSLASSVLTRQLEKKQDPSIAKFLPDRIHFSRSEHTGLRSYRREVPYNEVRQFYTFANKPNMFMLCYDGLYEGNRIYASFNCRVQNDIGIIRRMIYGEAGRSYATQGQSHQSVYYVDQPPQPTIIYEQEPQPVYVERPRSPVYVERVQERPTSTVYVERVQEHPTSTVYMERPRSPVYAQRSSYVKSSSRPQSMVYVEETPVVEETVYVERKPAVVQRVSKVVVPPSPSPPPPPPPVQVITMPAPQPSVIVREITHPPPIITETVLPAQQVGYVQQQAAVVQQPVNYVQRRSSYVQQPVGYVQERSSYVRPASYVQTQAVTYAQPQTVTYAQPQTVTYAQPTTMTYSQPPTTVVRSRSSSAHRNSVLIVDENPTAHNNTNNELFLRRVSRVAAGSSF